VFLHVVVIPAPIFLGIWFLFQFLQGALTSTEAAGVAWWAHIGGFVVGVGVALLLRATHHVSPPVERRLPYADHVTHYRVGRQPEW
jgi:membrane associated rhomboid family serine protease